jgi:hypothetical protein
MAPGFLSGAGLSSSTDDIAADDDELGKNTTIRLVMYRRRTLYCFGMPYRRTV